jgi:hypothetical protein
VLAEYTNRSGHCVTSWKEISGALRTAGLQIDGSGSPLDPTNVPYRLVKGGCDVDLDEHSELPRR